MQDQPARRSVLALLFFVAAAWTTSAGAAVSPTELRELYDKLQGLTVDEGQQLDAAGRVLVQEDLTVELTTGVLHPIVRLDGRIAGLVFVGGSGIDSGTIEFDPPDDVERGQLERFGKAAPFTHGISAAWILATDDSVDQLVEGDEWTAHEGTADEPRNLHSRRWQLYNDPLWDDWGPPLQMEVLDDLFGDGFCGGHVFAEFRTAPGEWVTYYRNPRGAILPTEEVAFFTHAPHGDAPQEVHIFSSYDSGDVYGDTTHGYDLESVELEVTVPKGGADRNLGEIEVVANLRVKARTDGVRGVQLELQGRARRTYGDEEWAEFDVHSVHAADGTSLSAVQDRNRLFVLLPDSLSRGETETLVITYSGPMIQPCGTTSYSPLMRYAWYPRAPWPDAHTFAATVHLPKALHAAATGTVTDETVEGNVRTISFRESGDVLWGALFIGEFLVEVIDHEGTPIRLLYAPSNGQDRKRVLQHVEGVLAYNEALWGDYPFDTLHVVDASLTCASGLMTGLTTGWLYGNGRDYRGISGIMLLNLSSGTPITTVCATMAKQWWGNVVVPASYRERWIVNGAVGSSARLFTARFASRGEYVRLNTDLQRGAFARPLPAPVHCGIRSEKYYSSAVHRGQCTMEMLLTQLGGDAWVQLMREVMVRAPESGISYEGFKGEADRYLGRISEPFFEYWIEGMAETGVECTYRITEDDDGTYRVKGTLTFDGPYPPNSIPLEIRYSRKDTEFKGVVPTGEETPFTITGLTKKPKSVAVDPENLVLLRTRKAASGD